MKFPGTAASSQIQNKWARGLSVVFWCYVVTWSHSTSGDSEASRPSFSGLSSLPLSIWALRVLASILYSVAIALASCAFGVWTCGGSLGSGEGAAWEVLCLWDSRLDTHRGKSLFVGRVPSGPWLLPELQHWGHLGGYFVYVLAAWNPGPMSFCLLQTSEKDVSKEGANNWYLVGFCNSALSFTLGSLFASLAKPGRAFGTDSLCVGAGFPQPRSVWETWWNVASHRLCSLLRPAALPLQLSWPPGVANMGCPYWVQRSPRAVGDTRSSQSEAVCTLLGLLQAMGCLCGVGAQLHLESPLLGNRRCPELSCAQLSWLL